MRSKARRTTHNNILILCEGTDTEYNYFVDLKNYVERTAPDRFAVIKIVPTSSEIIKTRNPKRKQTISLKEVESKPHYWCLEEHSTEEYDKYKQQPTRYVREVQLYMEDKGFTEGWAVFDKDVHPDHSAAFALAKKVDNLHIAFSSYCFEEWLLANFERNRQAYTRSECMQTNKQCGTGVTDDCHGTICLGGRLREKKYIPDYAKNKQNIFSNYTLSRLCNAFMNAAWLRHLASTDIYERNPYTDVDRLLARMLEKNERYEWNDKKSPIKYTGTQLLVSTANGDLTIKNMGTNNCIISKDIFFFCKEKGEILTAISAQNSILYSGSSFTSKIPQQAILLLIKEGDKHSFIEL